MQKYVFRFGINEEVLQSEYFLPDYVMRIIIETDGWNEYPASIKFEGSDFLRGLFEWWAQTAMNLHGYFIDPKRPTPGDLYEALSKSWQSSWRLEEGETPENPFPNPDEEMEE